MDLNVEFGFDNTLKDEIKNNKNLIIVGAKGTGKTMTSRRLENEFKNNGYNVVDFPISSCNEDLNKFDEALNKENQKMCIFLTYSYLEYFKNNMNNNLLKKLENIEIMEYKVTQNDAIKLYINIIKEYKIKTNNISKFLVDKKDDIIKHSNYKEMIEPLKFNKGDNANKSMMDVIKRSIEYVKDALKSRKVEYKTYIPAIIVADVTYLINEMEEACKNLNNNEDINNKINEIYNTWSRRKEKMESFLSLSGLELVETGVSLRDPQVIRTLTALMASVFSLFPVTLPISLGLIFSGGYFALKNWSNSKNENFIKNLANARIFWGNLNETEKRFISYKIERTLDNAEPETVYYALEGVFGKNVSEDDFNKFKDNIKAFVEKNGKEMLNKMEEIKNELQSEIKKLGLKIENVDKELDEMQKDYDRRLNSLECENKLGTYTDVIRNENFRIDSTRRVIKEGDNENKNERPLITEGLEDLKNKIINDLKDNKKILITGAKGSGKSTLAEWVISDYMHGMGQKWENVYVIVAHSNLDDKDINYLMDYNCNMLIYYDPSTINLYSSYKDAEKMDIKINEIPSITKAIEKINAIKHVPTLLVLSENDQVNIKDNIVEVMSGEKLVNYNIYNMDSLNQDIKNKINKNIYLSITNDDRCWDIIKDKIELPIQAKLLGNVFNSLKGNYELSKNNELCEKLKGISNNIYIGYVIYNILKLAGEGYMPDTDNIPKHYKLNKWFLPAYIHNALIKDEWQFPPKLLRYVNEKFFNNVDVNIQYYNIMNVRQHDLIENAINQVVNAVINKARGVENTEIENFINNIEDDNTSDEIIDFINNMGDELENLRSINKYKGSNETIELSDILRCIINESSNKWGFNEKDIALTMMAVIDYQIDEYIASDVNKTCCNFLNSNHMGIRIKSWIFCNNIVVMNNKKNNFFRSPKR